MSYQCFCLNYKNEERRQSMIKRFETAQLPYKLFEGVSIEDIQQKYPETGDHPSRAWSTMAGHLQMIHDFYYNTDMEYGIFCEDDIVFHKDLNTILPTIINDITHLKLDILLLGYLLNLKLEEEIPGLHIKYINNNYKYYTVHQCLWGAQMYIMTRTYSKFILNNYNMDYAIKSITNPNLTPFSSDYIITKHGNNAILYPMVCCEQGNQYYDNSDQHIFHHICHIVNYDKDNFI